MGDENAIAWGSGRHKAAVWPVMPGAGELEAVSAWLGMQGDPMAGRRHRRHEHPGMSRTYPLFRAIRTGGNTNRKEAGSEVDINLNSGSLKCGSQLSLKSDLISPFPALVCLVHSCAP